MARPARNTSAPPQSISILRVKGITISVPKHHALITMVLPGLAWDFSLSAILGDILPLRPCRHPELPLPSSRACRGISVLFHPGTGADPSPSTLSAKSSHVGFIFPIRNSFFSLRQRFSCFSRAIASRGSLRFLDIARNDGRIKIVSFREPGHVTRSMLMDPTHQAVRDSDIQRRLSLVGHHVNVKHLAGHEIPRLRSE